MKKFKVLFLLPIMLLGLASCEVKDKYENASDSSQFDVICRHGVNDNFSSYCYFLRDKETNIVYIQFDDKYHSGVSVYFNKDGKPMTYEEFQKTHKH